MRLLFDTSIAVALREGDRRVYERAEDLGSRPLLSIMSVVELEGGTAKAPEGAAVRRLKLDALYASVDILPFEWGEADSYRQIVEACGFSRPRIIDRMIAAQAIVAGATLITLNPRDFRDIPGLTVEDWSR